MRLRSVWDMRSCHIHTHTKKIKNNLDFKLKLEGFTLILDYIGKKNELLNQKTNSQKICRLKFGEKQKTDFESQ